MRKIAFLPIVALACLVGVAHADKVTIGGTHSSDEIKKTCGNAGGDYWEVGSSYGCVNECKNSSGGLGVCGVSCTSGKCTGTVPDQAISGGQRAMQNLLKGKIVEAP